MLIDEFDFELPKENVALYPVRPRDSARMLVVKKNAELIDKYVSDLTDFLEPNDILVINDTKVIPAELEAIRIRQNSANKVKISLNLHKKIDNSSWAAFARPLKRLKKNDRLVFRKKIADSQLNLEDLSANVVTIKNGQLIIKFDKEGAQLDEAIKSYGAMPLPPYISARRAANKADFGDYQTIYAKKEGAVAAPTAGLHFSDELFAKIKKKGVGIEKLTLHVGAGTFLPVKVENIKEHKMHSEWGEISEKTVQQILTAKEKGGRIVAVGTTSLRLLESAAQKNDTLAPFCGETDIFITPGFKFRLVDILMTNFHLPRSTLFMLVCAFSGVENMHKAYQHAIKNNYRFYSYGDASLLFRA